jgi:hypothetical protein
MMEITLEWLVAILLEPLFSVFAPYAFLFPYAFFISATSMSLYVEARKCVDGEEYSRMLLWQRRPQMAVVHSGFCQAGNSMDHRRYNSKAFKDFRWV